MDLTILRDAARWRLRGLGLVAGLVALSLVGCAGAQAEAPQAPAPVPAEATQAAAGPEVAPPAVPPVPAEAREAVVAARAASQRKRWDEVQALVPAASADPVLGMYPRYWLLAHTLSDRQQPVPEAAIHQFLHDFPDGALAERLRSSWILAEVRHGDDKKALAVARPAQPSSAVRCAVLLAQQRTGVRVHAREFLDAYAPNRDCWDLLDRLSADHVLSRRQSFDLLRASLEGGSTRAAANIAAALFDAPVRAQYTALIKDPRRWLAQHPKLAPEIETELVTIALARTALGDQREAAAQVVQTQWATKLPRENLQWVWGQFGLVAALNTAPDATRWYRRSGYVPMTDYNHAWQVRAELRAAPVDWARVADAIRKMGARQADEPVWRYWYGRALDALNNREAAQQYFTSIADGFDFYGQLAAEALGRTPALPPQPGHVDEAWIARARANPGLQRAVALFDLGWRHEAVPEWNFALRGMDDDALRGAAEFAREQHLYDRVINTSLNTRQVADFSQRFIAPFEDRVAAHADRLDLDTAWVYGLIRQESRFITDVSSHAGATGLMQLMPATARYVAGKIGMKFNPAQINDFETNTILGTHYLDMVLRGQDDSQVLATAGYNAGPARSKRWRASLPAPVEGAIFVETIPFTETRLYVKHVMSNASYYAMLFTGQPDSLTQRLGRVAPDGARMAATP